MSSPDGGGYLDAPALMAHVLLASHTSSIYANKLKKIIFNKMIDQENNANDLTMRSCTARSAIVLKN